MGPSRLKRELRNNAMQVRRDALSVNTEQRVCRFSYANGTADIART